MSTRRYWAAWAVVAVAAGGFLSWSLLSGPSRVFLPDRSTAGHHQIENACDTCHTPFAGVTNEPCLRCHQAELARANDSHPRAKFTDPRNADRLEGLNALSCVTCHTEHKPDATRAMGVTLPDDYCFACHQDVATDRPSHRDYPFDTCATGGCHNYHDNTALYEDFLRAHADDPAVAADPVVPARHRGETLPSTPVTANDGPPASSAAIVAEWTSTVHAAGGVNCSGCHGGAGSAKAGAWIDQPGPRACDGCHAAEVAGFFGGRHGMRLAAGLPAMTPAEARIPMKAEAGSHPLTCTSCHAAHRFDTPRAAVDACMGCHADRHTRAYLRSPHYRLWAAERDGTGAPGSGVSCATCHLPRNTAGTDDGSLALVEHNQNANLRPNEKMVRTVCLSCHGLAFSLDALADPKLVATNFTERPSRHVESIDMAVSHQQAVSK